MRLRPARSAILRFVALAFLLNMVATAGLLAFVDHRAETTLIGEERSFVADLQHELVTAHRRGGAPALMDLIDTRLAASSRGVVILWAGRDGRRRAGNLAEWPAALPSQTPWRQLEIAGSPGGPPRMFGASAILLEDGSRLLTARPIESALRLSRATGEAIATALALGAALMLASATVLGQLLSRRLKTIAATADAVGAGRIGARVHLDGSGDAFDDLGRSINAMLDRVEQLVEELRLVTDALAHDLRSPVTRLRTTIEHALQGVDDATSRAALERVRGEADTLLAMLSTALLITRTEAGIGRDRFAPTPLGPLLEDLAELYGPVAEDRGFALLVEPVAAPLTLPVHRELLSQAIGNLIENALNHATGGTRITLGVRATAMGAAIFVADNGPGIAPDLRPEALRRFGRLDPARGAGGSGLGLSLVAAIARLHGGTLVLEDNLPGLRVVLDLPCAPAAPI